MEMKDFFAVGISVVSLLMSGATLYLTQFRPASVAVSTGPFIHIFYAKPSVPLIFLPVVFHNDSPTKAIVYKAFLEVEDTKGDHFAMKWLGSVNIDLSNSYTDVSRAAPFKIDGYEAIPNALRFEWVNADKGNQLEWLQGKYTMKLHIWTSDTVSPNVTISDTFSLNAELATIMAEKKANSDNNSRYFPLDGKGLISFSTGKRPVDFSQAPRWPNSTD